MTTVVMLELLKARLSGQVQAHRLQVSPLNTANLPIAQPSKAELALARRNRQRIANANGDRLFWAGQKLMVLGWDIGDLPPPGLKIAEPCYLNMFELRIVAWRNSQAEGS